MIRKTSRKNPNFHAPLYKLIVAILIYNLPLLKPKGLTEENCSELPLFTDAMPIWNALHKFFSSYVDIFYADNNAVYFDKELAAFWERVDKRGDNGSPWRYVCLL